MPRTRLGTPEAPGTITCLLLPRVRAALEQGCVGRNDQRNMTGQLRGLTLKFGWGTRHSLLLNWSQALLDFGLLS